MQAAAVGKRMEMTRAGREPTEDVKRAFRRAIESAGLNVCILRMAKLDDVGGRWVMGGAKPAGSKHDQPVIEIHTLVKFSGEVGLIEIRCLACDEDPILHAFDAPRLRNCRFDLAELPQVLKEVWTDRARVVQRWKNGESLPIREGRWTWASAEVSGGTIAR